MAESQCERVAQLEVLCEKLAREHNKPVLPVPQGGRVEGRVVALLGAEQAERMRAVVVGERAVHVIGVRAATACGMLGARVTVENNQGVLTLTPRLNQARDVGSQPPTGAVARAQSHDR